MYLSECTSSYSSKNGPHRTSLATRIPTAGGMGSIPGQRTKIPHGVGKGFVKKKKNKKPWSSLSSLADFRSMCLSHGRLFNKYLSGIKDMSFFLIPLSKELFSSKISNPWVTLATQSDDGYRATQMPQNSRWVTLGWKSLRKYWCLWRAQEA